MINLGYDKEKLKRLCKRYRLSLIILHGSYARGINTAKSDIDMGFLGDNKIIRKKYFDILRDFSSIFGDKFDPVFLNGAESMITYQVAVNGLPLYEKTEGLFNSFKLGAIARYYDTKKFRELEKEYIKSIVKEAR